MDCARIHALFDRWLAGDLPPDQAAEFRAHLDGCAECSDVVAVLTGGNGLGLAERQRFAAAASLR